MYPGSNGLDQLTTNESTVGESLEFADSTATQTAPITQAAQVASSGFAAAAPAVGGFATPVNSAPSNVEYSYTRARGGLRLKLDKMAMIYTIGVIAIIVLIGLGAFLVNQKAGKGGQSNNSFAVGELAVKGTEPSQEGLALGDASKLTVNGQLEVSDSLVIKPGSAPKAPKEGQLYFDNATKQPYYYNGKAFVSLTAPQSVTALGGAAGVISLGSGLSVNGNTLSLASEYLNAPALASAAINAPRVSSLQGLTGDVSLTAGGGIAISGTTIRNSGVVDLTAGNGVIISNDGNGHYTIENAAFGAGGAVVLGPAVKQEDPGSNPSINIDKTGAGNIVELAANGVNTFVVDQTGAITVGTISYSQVQGRPVSTVTDLTGTPNQINVSAAYGSVVVSLPQDIATTSSPTFGGLTLNGGLTVTAGGASISGNASVTGSIVSGNAVTLGSLRINDGTGRVAILQPAILGQNTTYTLPDPGSANATLCLSTGNCATAGAAGGDLTGTYPNPTIASFQGTTLTVTGLTAGQILQYNGTAWVNQAVSGNATISPSGVLTIGNGQVTNAMLVNSSINVNAGTGLTGGGSSSLGGTTNIEVAYGAVAGTSVQGNTTLVCPAGVGNLTGGGDTITLGNGGSCSDINIVSSPTFSGNLSVEGVGGIQIGVSNTTDGQLVLANATNAFTTTIQSVPTQNQTIIIPASTVATDTVCLVNLSNCAGGAGDVTDNGYAQNYLTKYDSVNKQITASQIYDDGTSVGVGTGTPNSSYLLDINGATNIAGLATLNGDTSVTGSSTFTVGTGATSLGGSLTVAGAVTLSGLGAGVVQSDGSGNLSAGAISVSSGGTGATSFTTYGILYGNGTGAIQSTGSQADSILITNGAGVPMLDQTLPGAVQGNITSVGTLGGGSIDVGFGAIQTGNNITTTATLQGGTVNATSAIELNGTNINTAGTLSNVAYLNQANIFTASNTFTNSVNIQGGLTLGVANTIAGMLDFANTTNSNLTRIQADAPSGTGNAIFTLPSIAGGSSAEICTDAGNCPNSGVGGSGTTGRLTKFTGPTSIGDSGLAESGTTLTYNGNLIVNAASGFIGNLLDLQLNGVSQLAVNEVGALSANSDLIAGGELTVNGAGSSGIAGDLTIGTGLTVTAGGANISGNSTITGTLGVTSDATVGGNFNVTGVSTLGGNVSITGASTLTVGTGATTLGGTLSVSGDLSVGSSNFTVNAANGNTVVGGTFDATGATTLSGTLGVTGVSTFTGAVNANGGLTIATGNTFINASSTLLTAVNISDHPSGGDIGAAATTVDVATTFNVTQTTSGQTLSLPIPTSSTAGRIAYVNSLSGNADFTMYGVTIVANTSQQFIWNGTAWVPANIDGSGSGVTTVGALDSQTPSANGAVINSNTIYLQSASATYAGLVNTTTQSFAGDKTFTGTVAIQGAGTGLAVTNNATIGGTLGVTGIATFGTDVTVGGDLGITNNATVGGTFDVTGTATFGAGVTVTGTTTTGTLNATSAIQLNGTNINTGGTLNNVAYLDQANSFSAANTFAAAGTALTVTNDASIGGIATVGTLAVTANATVGGTLSVTSTSTFTGAVTANGGLTVAGTTTFNGNTSVTGSNTFTVGTGATTLGGTLSVSGVTTLTGAATASGGLTVSNGLTASGTVQLSSLSAGVVQSDGSGNLSSGNISVSNGGTGATSFTGNGILYGNGTGAIQSTNAANDSILVTDNAGNPSLSQYLPNAVQGNITQTGALGSGSIAVGFGAIQTGNNITTSATLQGGTVNATTTIELNGADINTAGTLTNVAYLNQANTFTAANTFTNTANIQGGLTLGVANTIAGMLDLANATNTNLARIQALAPSGTGTATFNLPSIAGGSTDEICTVNSGNCSGTGSSVTGSGTAGRIARFDATQNIVDSGLSESGAVLTYDGSVMANAANGFTGNLLDLQLNGTSQLTVDETGNVAANGDATIGGELTVSGTGSSGIAGDLTIGTGLTVTAGGANVTGNSTVTGTLGVTSDATVGGYLAVTGLSTLGGNVSITGASTLTVGTGATTLGGTLSVASTLGVTGATTLSSTLAVSSTSTFTGLVTANGGLTVSGATTLNNNATVGGTFGVSGTSTFGGAVIANNSVTANSGLTVTTGNTFTNASSTLLSSVAISDHPSGGDIGTAATTVDVATTFNVTQTTSGQTLSLPTPTNTAAGRIVYVNSLSGNDSFIMHGVDMTAGTSQQFIWNGSVWVPTNIDGSGAGVTAVGTLDGQSTSANGAVIASNTIYLQSASITDAGLVNTTTQSFAGDKTFTGNVAVNGGLTVGVANSSNGTISLANSTNNNLSILQAAAPSGTGNGVYNLPSIAGGTSADICLSTGNCAGAGGGITGSGTSGRLAKFNGSGSITDSALSESGSTLTYVGNLIVNAASGFTGNLLDLQLNGSTVLNVTEAGNTVAAGNLTINGTGASSIGGDLTVANGLTVTAGGADITGTTSINGDTTVSGNLTVTGNVAFQRGSDYSTTGQNDDVNFGAGSVIRLTGASAQTITGIAGGYDGRIITLINAGSTAATISNENASSSANNRITTGTGADQALEVGGSIMMIYDSADNRWRITGEFAGMGAGSGVTTLGALDSGTLTADGGYIDGTILYLQSADTTYAGLVNTTTQSFAGDKTFTGTVAIQGAGTGLAVTNNATIGGTLGVTGIATFGTDVTVGGDLGITNNATVGGTFDVTGTATFGAGVTVTGTTTTGTLNATSAIQLNGTNINTGGTLNNVAYLDQANSFSAANTFSGAGTALTVTNSASIGANLGVTGTTTTGTLSVTNNATVGGTLGVTGTSTLTGLVTANGGLTVNGATTLNGSVSISGANNFTVGTGAVTLGSLGAGIVTSNISGVLSSNVLDRNSATYFNTTLSVANGGTGATSFTNKGILYGNATGAIQATASANDSILRTDGSGNPALSQTLPTVVQGNITQVGALAAGSITSGFGTIATGNNITTTALVQGATGAFTSANALSLGAASGATGGIAFYGSGNSNTLTLQGPTSPSAGNYTLSIPAISGNATICTTDTICAGYAASVGGNYIAKDTQDTSSASVLGNLLGLANSNTGAAGVLSLTNAGTNSALSITQSANPSGGQAVIFANLTAGSPSGSLIDLRTGGVQRFAVAQNGYMEAAGSIVSGNGTFSSPSIASTTNASIFRSGDSTVSGNTGSTTLKSGNATNGNSGNVVIDVGTASGTAGTVSIGTANTSGVTIGRTGVATAIAGSLTVAQASTFNGNVGISGGNTLTVGTGATTLGGTLAVTGTSTFTGTITANGGITATGTTSINATGSSNTSIGNGTGTLAVVGSNSSTFTLNGVVIDATEFNRLDGKNAALVDVNDAVSTAITGTGALTVGSIGSGFGTISTGNNITTTANVQGGQLISTVTTGTAPLQVASTTLVTNLNADLLDGYHASSFALASGANYIAKNTNDTSSANYLGTLLGLTNTNTGAAGVLSLTSAGTNSALSITQSANPSSGQALIFANNTAGSPSGNLINLQTNGSSRFMVDTGGIVRAYGAVVSDNGSSGVFKTADTTAMATDSTGASFASGSASGAGSTSGNSFFGSGSATGGNSGVVTVSSGSGGNTGSLSLRTGNAGGGGISGDITMDVGTASAGNIGSISIGTSNASGITIGRSGVATTVQGSLSVNQAASLGSTLAVTGLGTFSGGLTINNDGNFIQSGTGTFSTGTGTVSLNGATTVSGNTSIANGYTFNVGSGATTLGGTLGVTGATTLSNTLAVTGTITGNSTIQGTRFISTVATGTAPLQVASTTLVTNLNADLLDGQHASYFAPSTGGNYIAKNTNDTSSASYLGTLLGLTNTNTGASGVLSLTNSGTGSALSIVQSGDPDIYKGLIYGNLTAGSPTGRLISLQTSSADRFYVTNAGDAVASGVVVSGAGYFRSHNQTSASTNSTSTIYASGGVNGATSNSGNVYVVSGNSSTSGNTGNTTISTGNATSGNSGVINIDTGSASGSTGGIDIGATHASSVLLGRTGINTQVRGTLQVMQGATLNSTLAVAGVSTFNGNVSVSGSNTLTVGSGATTLGGTLGVTGASTFSGNVSVSGSNTLTVGTGATLLGGSLGVVGATTVNALSVLGNSTFSDGLRVFGAGKFILGSSTTVTGDISFRNQTNNNNLLLQGPTTLAGNYTLSIPSISGSATICTTDSICAGYAPSTGGNYIAKNAVDSSTVNSLGYQLTLVNNNSGAAGVLALQNAGTSSALSITQSSNASSGQALIYANLTSGSPSGNLLDLRTGGAQRFFVNSSGDAVAQSTVVSAGGQFITHEQIAASTSSNAVVFRSGNVSGSTSNSGNVQVTSGNSTTSGNTGALVLETGDATSGNSGNIIIDVGTASGTRGTISVGATNASAVTISRTGVATTVAGTLTVTQAASLSSSLTVDGTVAYKKGADYSTTGSITDANFGAGSLIRLTGASAQTIQSIAGGTDGRLLTIINAGSVAATIKHLGTGSGGNLVDTGTGSDITLAVGAAMSLVYDSGSNVWRVIGSAGGTGGGGGATPMAHVYNNAVINIPSGTATAVTFNSELIDNAGMHSTSSNTSRLTATTSGYYEITGSMVWLVNATGQRSMLFRLNGASYLMEKSTDANSFSSTGQNGSVTFYLNAGDYVEMFASQNSGGSLGLAAFDNASPQFSMVKLDGGSGGGISVVGAIGGCGGPSANGASINGSSICLQAASASDPGLVTIGTQTFAGDKTFSGNVVVQGGASVSGGITNLNVNSNFATNINTGTSTGAVTIGSANAGAVLLQSGSSVGLVGAVNINASANNNTNINTGTSTGSVNIGNSAAGNINLTSNSSTGQIAATAGQVNITANSTTSGNINLNPNGTGDTGVIVRPTVDSTMTFQVQNAVGEKFLSADSVTGRLVVGNTSINGITWTMQSTPTSADISWMSVTYGNGLFVAVAYSGTGNRVMTSPDGRTWTSRISAADNQWRSVTYGNGLFVAVADSGTGNRVMTSPDGINWTSQVSAANNEWRSVVYGNGLFVAVSRTGTSNHVMTSPDGVSWTLRTPAANNEWTSVTYGNGLFVAVSQAGGPTNRIMTSPDGITWTSRTTPATGQLWQSITYGNGMFVATAQNGTGNRVMTSPDGITWTSRTSAADNNWNSVTYAGGLFVAVAPGGTGVMTSPDGITWTLRSAAGTNNWSAVTYGKGMFVAVAQSGAGNRVMTSENKGALEVSSSTLGTVNASTGITVKHDADFSSAFSVQSTSGINVFNVDTYSGTLRVEGQSNPGADWTIRTSAANNTWTSIAYGNGMFVAVALSGTGNRVMTSPDGITWTSRTSAANNSWQSVTYGAGLFVAVAADGTGNRVMTSPDGITWTSRTSAADNIWYSVTYGNGMFVAVSNNGTNKVMTSPDGITWTSQTSPTNFWRAITYANGLFVAVAQSGTGNRVMTSPDGITWTTRTSPADYSWNSITYGNGLFVAVANGTTGNLVMTSPDGITWTLRNHAATSSGWTSVTYGNGMFVALSSALSGSRAMTSPDGINWTVRSITDQLWQSITYGNGMFVAVAQSGTDNRVMTSTGSVLNINGTTMGGKNTGITIRNTYSMANAFDVQNAAGQSVFNVDTINNTLAINGQDPASYWTTRSSTSDALWIAVTYGNNTFVAISSSSGAVMTSPDGINWTARTAPNSNAWQSVTYGNGLFVAVARSGTGNRVMTSPDGINWTIRTSAADNNWYGVTYGNGLFVAVAMTGTGNRVMTSPDGINWTIRTSAADNNWYGVTYGNGLFVAVAETGSGNRVMTSPDGITWTIRTSAANNAWRSVTYGNGLFVGVSADGTGNRVMTSPDGITWTIRSSAADNGWQSVTYGNGLFVAVAMTGTGNRVMTSPDGITWYTQTSAADNSWVGVGYGNGLFVAVAQSGTGNRVMTSPAKSGGLSINNSTIGRTNSNEGLTVKNDADFINAFRVQTALGVDVLSVDSTNGSMKIGGAPIPGASWSSRTSAADNSWQSITYGAGLFVAVSTDGSGNRVMTSPDGINWTSRTSAADYQWTSVTYGNGLFVAVASSGGTDRVMTSPDGITWTIRNAAAGNAWTSVTYGNGLFVAVAYTGSGNRVMTSPDGITWTIRTSAANNSWFSVTYGNGLFVAVAYTGTGNRVMTSPDGINWTTRSTTGIDNSWRSVTYGNGLFVAVAYSGTGNRVMTSPDGIIWTTRTSAANNNWFSVTYGNGMFVAVASTGTGNRVMTSPDGITWNERSTAGMDNTWNGIAYGNGLFVAVSQSGTGNRVMTSYAGGTLNIVGSMLGGSNTGVSINNGVNLTNAFSVQNTNGDSVLNLSTVDGTLTVGGSTAPGSIGTTWTSRASAANNTWRAVTYANGLFVAVNAICSSNCVMTSPDGINWTSRTVPANNNWNSVTYGNGLFVAVASSGAGNRVMTSPDGITWTSRTSAADNNWQSVVYANGVFVAVAGSGVGNRVMTSTNGITWTIRTSAADNVWTSVTYANGLFVSVACGVSATVCNATAGNRVMTSPDGITWTSRTTPADNEWRGLTYGNGLFVAVAASGTGNRVMTSPDGITWTIRTSAADNNWFSVAYGNGMFVAVAQSGTGNRVMTSPDGITWTSRTSAADNDWWFVTYGNNMFVAISDTGTGNRIMTSSSNALTVNGTTLGGFNTGITIKNSTNQLQALNVQNASGTSIFNVDTVNSSVAMNGVLYANSGANLNTVVVYGSGTLRFQIASNGDTYVWKAAAGGGYLLCTNNNGGGGMGILVDCASSAFSDYAEMYPIANGGEYGDIVATGTEMVDTYKSKPDNGGADWNNVLGQITKLVKTTTMGQQNTIGIVSHNTGELTTTGHNIKESDNPMPVALNGRVPVKISPTSDDIQPGDYITTSTDPGKGTKATGAGFVIGKALSSWTSASGEPTVMVYVEQGYWNGPTQLDYIQQGGNATLSNLTVSGTADFNDINVGGNANIANLAVEDLQVTGTLTTNNLTVTGLAKLVDLEIAGHIITSGDQPTAVAQAAAGLGAAVTIEGNDTTGTITITTGASGVTPGELIKLSFSKAYGAAPRVVLSASNDAAADMNVFKGATTIDDFIFNFKSTPAPNTVYKFDYFIAQ